MTRDCMVKNEGAAQKGAERSAFNPEKVWAESRALTADHYFFASIWRWYCRAWCMKASRRVRVLVSS